MKSLASALATATVLLMSAIASADAPRRGEATEAGALMLSAAPAGLGAALILAGIAIDEPVVGVSGVGILTIGPSFGHYHTGDFGRGLLTTGVRTVGFAAMVLGAFADSCIDDSCPDDNGGKVAIGAGAVLVLGATAYDILDAPASARRNRRGVSVAPTVMPSASGPVGGLALAGAF